MGNHLWRALPLLTAPLLVLAGCEADGPTSPSESEPSLAAAVAQQEIPPHGHLLLLHADVTFLPPGDVVPGQPPYVINGFERCVELAAGQVNMRQHQNVHFGRAGEALAQAGHLVVPLAPFGPAEDCEQMEAIINEG